MYNMHFLALAYLTIMQLNYDVRVNSAYRTPDYNRTVGGKEGSKHTLGKAYDLATHHFDKQTKKRFIKVLELESFIYKNKEVEL